jgi:ABC-type polysaccharide/polyol phosphate transport system ATPase subunit
MHLSVEHLSIDFLLSDGGHGHGVPATPGAAPLGGAIRTRGRRSFVRAVDDVSFSLDEGDRLAIVGHNGSGKSTLLRALAGIYHPSSGSVHRSGDVSGIFNMALGFRQEASGYRNLVLKGLMAGRTRAQIEAALPEIIEFTGLGPYLDMPLHTYSQGMAMRLAFAATTAFTNDILVMDEWIGAGDAGFQEKIIARMGDFLHASTIIVLASHSTALLRRMANKAIWLEQGRVRMAGGVEVIDEYDASVVPSGMAPAIHALVRAGNGLWCLPAGTSSLSSPHLLWNVPASTVDLQLLVQDPKGGRRVVRDRVQRTGAWPLPEWVRPGMVFEIGNERLPESLAHLQVPPFQAA